MNELIAGHEAIDDFIDDHTTNGRPAKAELFRVQNHALLDGYHMKWLKANKEIEVMGVEESLTAPLYNIKNMQHGKRTSRGSTFNIAGKIDIRYKRNGNLGVMDHKTTSQDVTDTEGGIFWQQLEKDPQSSIYTYLSKMNGFNAQERLWDAVRKPSIRPKKDETLMEYGDRLFEDCIDVRPDWYFERKLLLKFENDIFVIGRRLWQAAQKIMHARKTNNWLENSDACGKFGGLCKFYDICNPCADEDGDPTWKMGGWHIRKLIHNELPELKEADKDLLTSSRLKSFTLCERKHYYDYELRLERNDVIVSEPLYFGSAWHAGQEAYWKAIQYNQQNPETKDDDTREPKEPVSISCF